MFAYLRKTFFPTTKERVDVIKEKHNKRIAELEKRRKYEVDVLSKKVAIAAFENILDTLQWSNGSGWITYDLYSSRSGWSYYRQFITYYGGQAFREELDVLCAHNGLSSDFKNNTKSNVGLKT